MATPAATWETVRQEFGKAMRGFYLGSATSGSASTLVQATWPILETRIGKNDFFEGGRIIRPDAVAAGDIDRQVPPNTASVTGYAPTTGTFTPDTNWTNAPINGEQWEWHGYGFDYTTMLEIANASLKRIPQVVTFVYTPSSSTYLHDLTASQSWLTNDKAVCQVSALLESGTQQQTITEAGSPGGGTFTLTYRGGTTSALVYNVTAAAMQTALRLLPFLSAVTVTRTGTSTNFVWTITMQDVIGPTPLFTADAALLTGGSSPTITPAESRRPGPFFPLRGERLKESDRVLIEVDRRYNQGTTTGDRLYVTCVKRAYYHCRATSSGVFGDRSAFAAEAHEAEPAIEWIVAGMLVEAWDRYPQAMNDAIEKRRILNMQAAHEEFRRWKAAQFTPPRRTFTGINAFVTSRPTRGFIPTRPWGVTP